MALSTSALPSTVVQAPARRVESEPIHLTFDPAVRADKQLARAEFLARRDAAEAAVWAEIAANRETAKTRENGRWMETR